MRTTPAADDDRELKQHQRSMWAQDDYHRVATEMLLDVRPPPVRVLPPFP
jgi:hypothetical protein